jgi:hypothetical protein
VRDVAAFVDAVERVATGGPLSIRESPTASRPDAAARASTTSRIAGVSPTRVTLKSGKVPNAHTLVHG